MVYVVTQFLFLAISKYKKDPYNYVLTILFTKFNIKNAIECILSCFMTRMEWKFLLSENKINEAHIRLWNILENVSRKTSNCTLFYIKTINRSINVIFIVIVFKSSLAFSVKEVNDQFVVTVNFVLGEDCWFIYHGLLFPLVSHSATF